MTSLLKEFRTRRIPPVRVKATPDLILGEVCKTYGMNERELICSGRERDNVWKRNIYYFIAREYGFCYREIGAPVNKDHATVLHGYNNTLNVLDSDKPWYNPTLNDEINRIRKRMLTKFVA